MRMPILALIATLLFAADASADCTSEVNDAFAKLRKSSAFAMETKISNEQGTLTMSNDYVLPDRMHQRVSMSSGGPGAMEMILVGSKAWSNQGQGWAEVPEKFASTIAKQMKETVVEPPKETSEFTCLGDVEFEGKTFAAYQAKRAAAAPTPRRMPPRRMQPHRRLPRPMCRPSTSTRGPASPPAISSPPSTTLRSGSSTGPSH